MCVNPTNGATYIQRLSELSLSYLKTPSGIWTLAGDFEVAQGVMFFDLVSTSGSFEDPRRPHCTSGPDERHRMCVI